MKQLISKVIKGNICCMKLKFENEFGVRLFCYNYEDEYRERKWSIEILDLTNCEESSKVFYSNPLKRSIFKPHNHDATVALLMEIQKFQKKVSMDIAV